MDLEKMLKEIEKVLKNALEGVLGNVDEVEKALIKQIEAEIKKEISIRNGKILKNKDNLKAINKLRSSLDKYISGQIASKLKSFKPAFEEIGKVSKRERTCAGKSCKRTKHRNCQRTIYRRRHFC